MRKLSLLVFFLVLLGAVGRSAPVSAEWFADLYIGPAFTQSETAGGVRYRFDNVFSGGGRAGYYFESIPWLGLGFDVSHYQPDGKAGGFNFEARITAFQLLNSLPAYRRRYHWTGGGLLFRLPSILARPLLPTRPVGRSSPPGAWRARPRR